MAKLDLLTLISAGAHFGHLTRRWNPKMKPYIFMERKGIHIIDLKKTLRALEEASQKLEELVAQGKTVLFVGTKKQAKSIIAREARRCEMFWVSERWLGGMLTNFATIRKSVKRMQNIDKMESDGTFEKITKKEQLRLIRERDKLRKVLEGIEEMKRLPGALFIVDVKKEAIAVKEAIRLNIPVFAIVDTNCDPDPIDYVIPANDDAGSAIELITSYMADAVVNGLQKYKEIEAEQKAEKEREEKEEEEKKDGKKVKRVRRIKFDEKGGKQVEKEEVIEKVNGEEEAEAQTETAEETSAKEAEAKEPETVNTEEQAEGTKTEEVEAKEEAAETQEEEAETDEKKEEETPEKSEENAEEQDVSKENVEAEPEKESSEEEAKGTPEEQNEESKEENEKE